MDVVAQIVGGQHADILVRQKSGLDLELGELLVAEDGSDRILLQVFDLRYGSQIQPEALEWASGLQLEDVSHSGFMEENLRNYVLAKVKAVAHVKNGQAFTPKTLPKFFSGLRRLQDADVTFLENPEKPLHVGNIRCGSRTLEKEVVLDGTQVLPTHVLIAAGTGKGKSLDGNEEVLIKDTQGARFVTIEKLVNEPQPDGLEVYSFNPETMRSSFKKVTGYLRHEAPAEMYTVITDSGRRVTVTGDHSLHVLRKGCLVLLPTNQIQAGDYAASALRVEVTGEVTSVNLFDLLEDDKNIVCILNQNAKAKVDSAKLDALIARKGRGARSTQAMRTKGKIWLAMLRECLRSPFTSSERRETTLALRHGPVRIPMEYTLTPEFMRYLGYYLAEGSCYKNTAVRITNGNPKVQDDVTAFAKTFGANAFRIKKGGRNTGTVIGSRLLARITTALAGHNASNKRMPDFAPGLAKPLLAELLRGYYEGDGGLEDGYRVSATTKSEKLASGLTYCLSRFGIHARIHEVYKKVSGSEKPKQKYFKVTVTGFAQVQAFMQEIGFLYKQYPLRTLEGNTNVDVIPIGGAGFRRVREALRMDQDELGHSAGVSRELISMIELGKRKPSRESFRKILQVFENRLDRIGKIDVDALHKGQAWLDPSGKKVLADRIRSTSTFTDVAANMPSFSDYRRDVAANGLHRILRRVDSVHVIEAYNVLENNQNVTPETLRNALQDAVHVLNYPHPDLPDYDRKCGYDASANEKNKLSAKGLRHLIGHVLNMHAKAMSARDSIEAMKRLLNLRWEKIKSVEKQAYAKPYVYDISVEENETFYAGRGGLFVHNSNLTKYLLYKLLDSTYCGVLVLDPHNEYAAALQNHPHASKNLVAYSPNPGRGGITLKINYKSLKPWHFSGIVPFTEAQNETIWTYYKEFKADWLQEILSEEISEKLQPRFERRALKEETLRVLQRKLELALRNNVFSEEGGQTTVADIAQNLDDGKIVVIDTSGVSSDTELLIGSILANDAFEKAKQNPGKLKSIVIEEAPRVLKEGASNVFSSIAREGRKFGVGLIAITQLASLIPREVLANMNTKIILGNEMRAERDALIGSAAQDLSDDSKTIAGLDKGEAIISSVYTKFALPVQFPKFEDVAKAQNTVQKRFA